MVINLPTTTSNSIHEHMITNRGILIRDTKTNNIDKEKTKTNNMEDNREITLDIQNKSSTTYYGSANIIDMFSEDLLFIQELCYIKKVKIKDLLQVIRILLK